MYSGCNTHYGLCDMCYVIRNIIKPFSYNVTIDHIEDNGEYMKSEDDTIHCGNGRFNHTQVCRIYRQMK